MKVLFVHSAFPAQFGRLGLELTRRYDWECKYIVDSLGTCPPPTAEMLDSMYVVTLPPSNRNQSARPWSQSFGATMELARDVYNVVASRSELRDVDLVVGHLGLGPTMLLPELLSVPFVNYCEYFFATQGADLTYRIDLPAVEPTLFYPRCINATQLLGLTSCQAGYSPTRWQRASFPSRFHSKLAVHFDGTDTQFYRPRADSRPAIERLLGKSLPANTKIVTFAARGLESVRGFDVFLDLASRIARERSDTLFVVAGAEEGYYGWDQLQTGGVSFKAWSQARFPVEPARIAYVGQVPPATLADILAASDLHLYPTVPFVPGWSLFDALASGCLVLASDVGPVREVIEPGVNGLVAPFYDIELLTQLALQALANPSTFAPLRTQARATIETRYSMEVCVPELARWLAKQA